MTVSETKKEALMLVMVAMAMGVKSRPSTPVSPRRGRKTRMMNKVAYRIEFLTSADALAITSREGFGAWAVAFSRSRRNTFSTSTMASSTTIPMATARPPSVIALTLMSKKRNTIKVMAKERGIAVRVISVVLTFSRKSRSTSDTMMAPSRMASSRFPIAFSIKSACRKSGMSSTLCGAAA